MPTSIELLEKQELWLLGMRQKTRSVTFLWLLRKAGPILPQTCCIEQKGIRSDKRSIAAELFEQLCRVRSLWKKASVSVKEPIKQISAYSPISITILTTHMPPLSTSCRQACRSMWRLSHATSIKIIDPPRFTRRRPNSTSSSWHHQKKCPFSLSSRILKPGRVFSSLTGQGSQINVCVVPPKILLVKAAFVTWPIQNQRHETNFSRHAGGIFEKISQKAY